MLHLLRAAAKTWVFRGLFALLIISFAVWGIGDLSLGGSASPVAQVGERRVTVQDFANALAREVNSVSRQAGRPIQIDEAQALGIPDALLARIIRDAALDEEARGLGLSASDEAVRDAILESPSFAGLGGTFDPEQYRFILGQIGFSVERFEQDLRRSLAREAVQFGVSGGALGAPGFADAIVAREFEARRFDTLTLPLTSAPDPGTPNEGQLATHHEENAPSYEAPERRRAAWVEISAEAIASTVDIAEDELLAEYDAQIARFDLPERRVVERIVYPDEAAAQAALADLRSGAISFIDAAEARGLTPGDIDLGEVERGDLGDAADAVFAAGLDVAGPAPSAFGPALLNVVAVLPARTTPFEDARREIRDQLALETAEALAAERAEEAADLLAAGAPLEEIAEDLTLPLRSGELTLDGEDGVEPQIIAEAFIAEPGAERELIEAGRGFALVRVDEVIEAALRPLSEVREQVAADWAVARRQDALTEIAARAAQRLEAGESIDDLAAELNGIADASADLRRGQASIAIPLETVEPLYAAAVGAAAQGPTPSGRMVVQLVEVLPADVEDGPAAQALESIRQAIDGGVAQDLYAYYAAEVQEGIAPSVNTLHLEQAVNALRGGHGGGY